MQKELCLTTPNVGEIILVTVFNLMNWIVTVRQAKPNFVGGYPVGILLSILGFF